MPSGFCLRRFCQKAIEEIAADGLRKGIAYLYSISENLRVSSALYLFEDTNSDRVQLSISAPHFTRAPKPSRHAPNGQQGDNYAADRNQSEIDVDVRVRMANDPAFPDSTAPDVFRLDNRAPQFSIGPRPGRELFGC
jgi:hypothetical protein